MPVESREARPGEEEQFLDMYRWLFTPPGSKPRRWGPESARHRPSDAIASPRSAILVADDAGSLIAFCADVYRIAAEALQRHPKYDAP